MTGVLLIIWLGEESAAQEMPTGAAPAPQQQPAAPAVQDTPAADTAASPAESVTEAARTLRDLALGFYEFLPRLGIAIVILILAGILARVVRPLLRRVLANWERADATAALGGILIWLLALGTALSVLAGDARALVGSVGLFGLALSWALQTPIESFTGWLMNSFRSYYRIGDRIAVGDLFGDVYRIDFLTTTVWEAGGPEKPVQGAQPTGALITFPNAEILRSNIVNYTRDFPFVWDEVTIAVANESDLAYAARLFEEVAAEVLGEHMVEPARAYGNLLQRAALAFDVATEPQAFMMPAEAWTDVTVRYLVPARERRRWASALYLALNEAMARPQHRGRVMPGYLRAKLEVSGEAGAPPAGQ